MATVEQDSELALFVTQCHGVTSYDLLSHERNVSKNVEHLKVMVIDKFEYLKYQFLSHER